MSLSSSLSKIGLTLAGLCIVAGLSAIGSNATADDGTGPTPPPPTTTTPPAGTNGNPWHD
jgi:hypothetical protein